MRRYAQTGKSGKISRMLGFVSVCMMVVALCAPAAFASSSGPFDTYAGYQWVGPNIMQTAADWTIPTIPSRSTPGVSSEMMYILANNGAGVVGIYTEQEIGQPINTISAPPAGTSAYFVGWQLGDQQTIVAAVSPGDKVRASLVHQGKIWDLSFTDLTQRWNKYYDYTGAGTASFTNDSWQVSRSADQRGFLIPWLDYSSVGFTNITVNGHPPTNTNLVSQFMSVPNETWAPTPMINGSFTLAPIKITNAAIKYFVAAENYDNIYNIFNGAASTWKLSTPLIVRNKDVQQLSKALLSFNRVLGHTTWPPNVLPYINMVKASNDAILTDEQALAAAPSIHAPAFNRLYAIMKKSGAASHHVRELLNLPTNTANTCNC